MARPEVFYTYEWAQAVQRAYRTSLHPLLVLAYENDALVGVASLATRNEGDVCFLAATTADYCDFVCSAQDRPDFTRAVLAELLRLKTTNLVLANVPAESDTLCALTAVCSEMGYRLFSQPAYCCAQVLLRSSEQRERVRRSVCRKQAARRHLAAMEKLSPVKLDHRVSGGEIAELLPDFAQAHVARYLQNGRLSNLLSAERRVFLQELAELLSKPGWMTFSRLLIGDRTVAWNYGFRFAGSWFWYQPAFDLRWKQYSPGFCLLTKIVEEACRNEEIDVVDLGLGQEGYKERIATGSRSTLHFTVTRRRSRWAYEVVRYHATAGIKAVPYLENKLRVGRDRILRMVKRIRTAGLSGLSSRLWRRSKEVLLGQPRVFFFEWPKDRIPARPARDDASFILQEVTIETLARAAMRYSGDEETLGYLSRAVRRLGMKSSQGFALTDAEGVPVHFVWAGQFEGFFMSELWHKLKSPSANAVLLFDCWTPVSVRGCGYYGQAIANVASTLRASGKSPWIFSSAANLASLQGVKKTGFEPKFSLTRKRRWRGPELMTSPTAVFGSPVRDSSAA